MPVPPLIQQLLTHSVLRRIGHPRTDVDTGPAAAPRQPLYPSTPDPFFPVNPTAANPTAPPTFFPTTPASAALPSAADVSYLAPPPTGGPVVPYGFPTMAPETADQFADSTAVAAAAAPPASAALPSWVWVAAAAGAALILFKSDRRIRRTR